jgi:hypothetical protein
MPHTSHCSRDSEAGRPDMTAAGVSVEIATHRCRPGLMLRRIVSRNSDTSWTFTDLFAFIPVTNHRP